MKSIADTLMGVFSSHAPKPTRQPGDSAEPRERGGPHRHSQFGAQWRPIPPQLRTRMFALVESFEAATRTKGKQGVLKLSGVAVFRTLLFQFLNPRTGQCDPCYETIAAKAGVSRSTVHTALKRLEQVGVIERTRRAVRRYVTVGRYKVASGWMQTSNAYRLGPPRQASLLVDVPPEYAARWAAWVASWQKLMADMAAFFRVESESNSWTESTASLFPKPVVSEDSPLTAALNRLGEAIRTSAEGITPGDAYGRPPKAAYF